LESGFLDLDGWIIRRTIATVFGQSLLFMYNI